MLALSTKCKIKPGLCLFHFIKNNSFNCISKPNCWSVGKFGGDRTFASGALSGSPSLNFSNHSDHHSKSFDPLQNKQVRALLSEVTTYVILYLSRQRTTYRSLVDHDDHYKLVKLIYENLLHEEILKENPQLPSFETIYSQTINYIQTHSTQLNTPLTPSGPVPSESSKSFNDHSLHLNQKEKKPPYSDKKKSFPSTLPVTVDHNYNAIKFILDQQELRSKLKLSENQNNSPIQNNQVNIDINNQITGQNNANSLSNNTNINILNNLQNKEAESSKNENIETGKSVKNNENLYMIQSRLSDLSTVGDLDYDDVQQILSNLTGTDSIDLLSEQLKLEGESLDSALDVYKSSSAELMSFRKGTSLNPVQKIMVRWYPTLYQALADEIELCSQAKSNSLRKRYLPYLESVPLDQLTVLVSQVALNTLLFSFSTRKEKEQDVSFVSLCFEIGKAVNSHAIAHHKREIIKNRRKSNKQSGNKNDPFFKLGDSNNLSFHEAGDTFDESTQNLDQPKFIKPVVLNNPKTSKSKGKSPSKATTANSQVEETIAIKWSDTVVVSVGAVFVSVILKTLKVPDYVMKNFLKKQPKTTTTSYPDVNNIPCFSHRLQFRRRLGKMYQEGRISLHPAMKSHLSLSGADLLEAFAPKFKPMVVKPRDWTAYNRGAYLSLFGIVMRVHNSHGQIDALKCAPCVQVYEGLNYLGQTPWLISNPVLAIVEDLWARGGGIMSLPSRADYPYPQPGAGSSLPESPFSFLRPPGSDVVISDRSTIDRRNAELHSLRCDLELKLAIARQFKDRIIYFPFNIDFRGRAYPIPPHLSHMGNDMCRSLLIFEKKQKLGVAGMRWLKIHVANLYGLTKISFDDRIKWVDTNMPILQVIADSPTTDDSLSFWTRADSPFQFIGAVIELVTALRSPDPFAFESGLPIHQDGSCNGLQHYAAMGRDKAGGTCVNLTPSDRPQDVYMGVCNQVIKLVEEDAAKDHPLAIVLKGHISRKVVKQTVMTSVYGVTLIGAREQIYRQLIALENVNWPHSEYDPVLKRTKIIDQRAYDQFQKDCALYLARMTLAGLESLFTSARAIMTWLADCASLLAQKQQPVAWVTPLGLPVVQPYRQERTMSVRTETQSVVLSVSSDLLPVSGPRQRSAFPPNFVHSLDATHMLLTANRCKAAGLTFSAVHDSYWTHAGSMDKLSALLREQFVELYEKPILEDLRTSWELRFPDIDFPPIPPRGELDLKQVKNSPYFFA